MKFVIYIILFLITSFALLFLEPDSGTGNGSFLSGPSGYIPKSAVDIEWHAPAFGPMYTTKFRIDEGGFRQWAKEWKEREPGLSDVVLGNGQVFNYDSALRMVQGTIYENIYFSSYKIADRWLLIAYDPKTQFAYYNFASR